MYEIKAVNRHRKTLLKRLSKLLEKKVTATPARIGNGKNGRFSATDELNQKEGRAMSLL